MIWLFSERIDQKISLMKTEENSAEMRNKTIPFWKWLNPEWKIEKNSCLYWLHLNYITHEKTRIKLLYYLFKNTQYECYCCNNKIWGRWCILYDDTWYFILINYFCKDIIIDSMKIVCCIFYCITKNIHLSKKTFFLVQYSSTWNQLRRLYHPQVHQHRFPSFC